MHLVADMALHWLLNSCPLRLGRLGRVLHGLLEFPSDPFDPRQRVLHFGFGLSGLDRELGKRLHWGRVVGVSHF